MWDQTDGSRKSCGRERPLPVLPGTDPSTLSDTCPESSSTGTTGISAAGPSISAATASGFPAPAGGLSSSRRPCSACASPAHLSPTAAGSHAATATGLSTVGSISPTTAAIGFPAPTGGLPAHRRTGSGPTCLSPAATGLRAAFSTGLSAARSTPAANGLWAATAGAGSPTTAGLLSATAAAAVPAGATTGACCAAAA